MNQRSVKGSERSCAREGGGVEKKGRWGCEAEGRRGLARAGRQVWITWRWRRMREVGVGWTAGAWVGSLRIGLDVLEMCGCRRRMEMEIRGRITGLAVDKEFVVGRVRIARLMRFRRGACRPAMVIFQEL